jgi:hypothetical protein
MQSRLFFLGSLLVAGCTFDKEIDLGPTGGTGGPTSSTGGVAPGGGGIGLSGARSGGVAPQGGGRDGGGTPGNGGVVTGGTASGGAATGGVVTGGTASGGTATGGVVTGGMATGGAGASVPECEIVSSLPEMGADCTQAELGLSWCLPNGDRCVCQHDTWYCNTRCATDYPTLPERNASCLTGAACNYPTGESCTCIAGRWRCLGQTIVASCAADGWPTTGDPCQESEFGTGCEYPYLSTAFICECGGFMGLFPPLRPGQLPTWTCYQSAFISAGCPATQPPYDFDTKCPMGPGGSLCLYGSTQCLCMSYSDGAESPYGEHYYPWICGLATYPQSYFRM